MLLLVSTLVPLLLLHCRFSCLWTVDPSIPAPPSIQQGRSWQLPCRLLEEMSSSCSEWISRFTHSAMDDMKINTFYWTRMIGNLVTWDLLLNFTKVLPFETAQLSGFPIQIYLKLVGPFCHKVLMEITFIRI